MRIFNSSGKGRRPQRRISNAKGRRREVEWCDSMGLARRPNYIECFPSILHLRAFAPSRFISLGSNEGSKRRRVGFFAAALVMGIAAAAMGQTAPALPNTVNRPDHVQSELSSVATTAPVEPPELPDGMTLEQVLDHSARTPPPSYPNPIHDDELYAFTLIKQLEYRAKDHGHDQLGWNAYGFIGYDLDKFWWKSEGDVSFDGISKGESENDFLYSRLITPYWNAQIGFQYANDWKSGDYNDRFSGVLALEGLAPGMFEVETSLYVSQDADIELQIEAEVDLRLTQRLVLQPRTELRLYAQDIAERNVGAGLGRTDLEMRLRYEIRREIAPYVGIRYSFLSGETADIAARAGDPVDEFFVILGVRLAF